jgi:hypothetical protein
MSHFTLQIEGGGPILSASVSVSEPRLAALKAAGRAIPQPVAIRALVDTGASCTCVDPTVLNTLGLTPTGSVSVNTPSTGATPHDTYQFDVALLIPGPSNSSPLVFQTIPVVSAELLAAQTFHALIGRDILDKCVLVYNGGMKLFTLAF